MDPREASAQRALRKAMSVYLTLPPEVSGRIVLHFSSGGHFKGYGIELGGGVEDAAPPMAVAQSPQAPLSSSRAVRR